VLLLATNTSSTNNSYLFVTRFTVLDIAMVFEDDHHEVIELIESMLVFVFRALQERKQYRPLIKAVQRHYSSTKPFRVGLDAHGKVPRLTFLEAKSMLREALFLPTDDDKTLT